MVGKVLTWGGNLSYNYKIDYSVVFEVTGKGRICLIQLVGTGGVELPTPCAQDRRATGGRRCAEMSR